MGGMESSVLYTCIHRLDQAEWERRPLSFADGASAFLLGLLTLFVPSLFLQPLPPSRYR